jgi:hypothetical protein
MHLGHALMNSRGATPVVVAACVRLDHIRGDRTGGEAMSIWLRYLAIAAFVGNGLTAFWNLIGSGRMSLQGSLGGGIDRLALNLCFSLVAIVLAALIAAPTQRDVSLSTKIIAVPSVLGGGLGVLSSAMLLYPRTGQPQTSLSTDALAVDLLVMERAVQTAFFSACTLALAILVLASRRSSA